MSSHQVTQAVQEQLDVRLGLEAHLSQLDDYVHSKLQLVKGK